MAGKISGTGRQARTALASTVIKKAEYHQQDEPFFCGSACAQMALTCVGRPVGGSNDQGEIQTVIRNNNGLSTWASDPLGLAFVLNFPPSGYQHPISFKNKEESSKQVLSKRIVLSLRDYKLPAAVLVWGSDHWILVTEYELKNPGSKIFGFMIYNPAPFLDEPNPVASVVPPPHGTGDDCGTGFENISTYVVNRAVKNHHLSYAGWICGYLTMPVDWDTGDEDPGGNFAMVCVTQAADASVANSTPLACSVPRNGGATPEVSASQALPAAWQGMLDHSLNARAPWSAIFQGAPAGGDHGIPAPIYREDTGKWFYAIPYYGLSAQGNRSNLVATMVDGHLAAGRPSPDYLESIAVENGQAMSEIDPQVLEVLATTSAPIVNARIARAAKSEAPEAPGEKNPCFGGVIGTKIVVRDDGRERTVVFGLENLNKRTPLVWKPCLESLTPFDPFYLFSDPENPDQPIYVRSSDLRGFTRPSDYLRGGLPPKEAAK